MLDSDNEVIETFDNYFCNKANDISSKIFFSVNPQWSMKTL